MFETQDVFTLSGQSGCERLGPASICGMETGKGSDAKAVALGKRPEEIHVLLVDDEKLSRVVVGNLLRKCQYQVTVATSGLEALDILRKHEKGTFHLILTDVMMPDVDGIELLRHVRSDEALNNMPVVMMSANEHTETVFECIRRGAEDYLLKPVTKKEVQYICQHVWRRQKEALHSVPQLDTEQAEADLAIGVQAETLYDSVPNSGGSILPRLDEDRPNEAEESPATSAAASAREAAGELLTDRQQSGSGAGFSGRVGSHSNGRAPRRQSSANGAVVEAGRLPLNLYFAHRKTVVNGAASFQIFCAAVALVQDQHSKGGLVKVRPSRLSLTQHGTLTICASSQRQAEVEDKLYASPEELLNKPLEAASDIYSLGVLFFELFNPVMSATERMCALSGLRHRILPIDLLQGRPQEAAFVLSLLHPDPSARPSAAQLLKHDCLSALQHSICRHPELQKANSVVDVHMLLDFLRLMHSNKEAEATHIKSHLDIIDKDILQVSRKLRELLAHDRRRRSDDASSDSSGSVGNAQSGGSRGKREREPLQADRAQNGVRGRNSFEIPKTEGLDAEERAKWTRIWQDFPVLETVYLQRREGDSGLEQLSLGCSPRRDCLENGVSPDGLADFSKDLSMLAKQSKLVVKAEMKYGDLMGEGDMVCSAAFDREDEFFATAGVSKRIKVFELASVLDEDSMLHYPVLEIGINSKISSLCWNSYVRSCLLAADYEGAIQLWDVSANAVTAQYEEHNKRVWSVDFSQTDPTRFASGGDDGAVKLWSMRDAAATATIDSKANVCSVQLSPTNSNLLAFGSANYRVYLYDLRRMAKPLAVIGGHRKAVSYVRFMGADKLVSASTDNSLKLWDVTAAAANSDGDHQSLMTYYGHTNERNFVGLSVNSKGYIACGSESNEVYTYYHRLPLPLASHSFALESSRMDAELEGRQFVSTVCWAHRGTNLLAANSAGVIKVLSLAQ